MLSCQNIFFFFVSSRLRGILFFFRIPLSKGTAPMPQPVPPIHILVVVTHDDTNDGITRLLQSAGVTVADTDFLDKLESCVQENTTLVYPVPGDDCTVIDEILRVARNHQKTVHCCIVPSKQFAAMREDLRKQLLLSKRRPECRTLDEVERDHIIKTLDETAWQYKTAAQILGIDRSTLYRKLKKFGIQNSSNR